jgi:hypothetical protein
MFITKVKLHHTLYFKDKKNITSIISSFVFFIKYMKVWNEVWV